ncbi:MAG: efflux RND transporter periplasmic adaptor subunit [Betaproteobacteria bacterium]
MKTPVTALSALGLALLSALGGYWLGQRSLASDASAAAASAASTAGATKARKLLYYRNPMGLADTSSTPKKDPMGMDYIAVYEGEDDAAASGGVAHLNLSTEKIQKLGVRTETAQMRALQRQVRAAARIEPDERRLYTVAPKFEGYVESLHVNVTGQAVAKGQPLFEAYSPELVSAQREYALAAKGQESLWAAGAAAQASMTQLAQSALTRLRNWDVSQTQIKALAQSGEPKRSVSFLSPVAGIVMEKKAVQGMRFMPGEALYQVADLSSVWVIADVFEQDIALVQTGQKAQVSISAYPDKAFAARVSYVYPTLKAETRTVQVRMELANPGLLLKPGMFAQVELTAPTRAAAVTVPVSAVIDSGARQIVLVQLGAGRFEPRAVRLGERNDEYVQVLQGLSAGEEVVVAANFLIDAESNLRAAITGFGATPSASASAPVATQAAGHQAQGTVQSIDAQAGTVSLSHGPVPSLKWPAMTMEFKLANASLGSALQPGAKVAFEFVQRQPGEWVITAVKPAASAAH